MFNGSIRPRCPRHEAAVITELDDHWVTARLRRPVGRFRDGEVRCPPLALQKARPRQRNLTVASGPQR
jgi:hypothetical protein